MGERHPSWPFLVPAVLVEDIAGLSIARELELERCLLQNILSLVITRMII